jgi:uncharacterized protein involved in type VI secretion and phage assembly
MLGSEGGLARFRLRLTPWLWRLSQVRNSRVWQDKTVVDIIDDVFEHLRTARAMALERRSRAVHGRRGGAQLLLPVSRIRLDFVQRLLTEEGLAWRYEQLDDGVGVVLFADSSQESATPEDASSKAGGASATMACALARRQTHSGLASAPRRDGVGHHAAELRLQGQARSQRQRAVAACSPASCRRWKVMTCRASTANAAQAQRYADIQMQGREAAAQLWRGRSTVRTMAAGTRFTLTQVAGGDAPPDARQPTCCCACAAWA